MAINVSQAFHRTSANPVDESMALTKAQMLTVNDNLMPAYYFTICQDDGDIYLYDKTATPSVTTGKFTKFEGGGGGGTGEGVVITKTLLASGWDANNRQSLTFNDYTDDMGGVIGMPTNATAAQKEAYAAAVIDVYSQSGNVFTFECEEVPSVDLPVTLYAGGSGGSGSGVPAGGTTGQVLAKKSNTDGDVEWKDVANPTQVSTMPTASATNLGQIVQYVGTTTTTAPIYVNGLFYECVSDGESTPTYSWEQKDVQSYPEIDLTNVFASGFPVASVSGARQFEYSTGEQVVGTWIDGKPIYQITVDCGNLPKSNLKRVDYSSLISNVKNFLKVEGIFFSSGYAYPLPYVNRGSIQYQIQLYIEKPEIMIWTADNFVDGQVYVTLQYTKTTD